MVGELYYALDIPPDIANSANYDVQQSRLVSRNTASKLKAWLEKHDHTHYTDRIESIFPEIHTL